MGYLSFLPLWLCLMGAGAVAHQEGPPPVLTGSPTLNLDWYTVTPAGVISDKAGPCCLSGGMALSPIGIDAVAPFCLMGGFWSSECDARLQPDREEVVISAQKPATFKLYPNSPNPFRQTTRIAYDLPARSRVLVRIYDADGRQVRELTHGWQDAGRYSLNWDRRDARDRRCPAGVYFCSAGTEDRADVTKVLVAE